MKALSTSLIAAMLLIAGATAHAQDTCKIFTITNPHGADMEISRIWVVDTVNFRVSTVKQLPFQLGATESFDIVVCILSRDGKKHSTQVRYQNTHGTSSYNVSMDAPASTSGVSDLPAENAASVVGACTPSPASGAVSIAVAGRETRGINVQLYSVDGALVQAAAFPGIVQNHVTLDVSQLPNGFYVVIVSGETITPTTRNLVVNH